MKKQLFMTILLTLIAIVITLNFLSVAHYSIGPFTAQLQVKIPAKGRTVVSIPPLGEIKNDTHAFPLQVVAKLSAIDLEKMDGFLADLTKGDGLDGLKPQIRKIIYTYLARLLILALCVGGFLNFLWMKKKGAFLYGAIASLLVFVILGLFVIVPYDTKAFENPDFAGILEEMPWFLRVVEEGVENYHVWQANLLTLTNNLSNYYLFRKELRELSEDEIELRILHVSDIHNNALAISLLENLIEGLKIDFIVDTGDLTDFGTSLELGLTRGIEDFGVPYVFVPGNHDSPEVIDTLKDLNNIVILKEDIFSFKGINIYGLADPVSDSKEFSFTGNLEEYQNLYKDKVLGMGERIDILAIHNLQYAQEITGDIPIILYGHNHQQKYSFEKGTHLIGAGSTGAEGLRGLQLDEEKPYTAVILNFDKTNTLLAIDLLQFTQNSFSFSVKRIFV